MDISENIVIVDTVAVLADLPERYSVSVPLLPITFTGAPFRLQTICRSGVAPRRVPAPLQPWSEFLDETYPAKTRRMGLLCGENCMILTLTVFD